MARRFSSWVDLATTGQIAKFRFLYCDDQLHADDPAFCAALDEATGVWFPAAYQGKLAWRFTKKYSDETSERATLFQQSGASAQCTLALFIYQSSRTVKAMTRGVIVPAARVLPLAVYRPVFALVFDEFSGWPAGVV